MAQLDGALDPQPEPLLQAPGVDAENVDAGVGDRGRLRAACAARARGGSPAWVPACAPRWTRARVIRARRSCRRGAGEAGPLEVEA